MAIEKMKKVSLVVLDSTRKESLKRLRKIGLVHLETVEGQGAVLAAYKESSSETDKAISILEEIKLPKKKAVPQESLSKDKAREKAGFILSLAEKKKSLQDSITQNTQELERLCKWGSVNPEDFRTLAGQGLFLYMYEIPQDKYALIGNDVSTVLVNSTDKVSRFLLLSGTEITERPAGLPPEAYAVPMAEKSSEALTDEIRRAEQEISRIERELSDSKRFESALHSYKNLLASDIEFETVYSGMSREAGDDGENSSAENGAGLAWLTGYVPERAMNDFSAACRENEWAFACADPADDDPVPTKLRNNRIVSMIYPLMDFLDVTPGYHEFDISGWFLLFFCIFFAMIFGDACYGALIALLGLLLLCKSKKGSRSLSVLVTVLGLCTCAWGVMTCSWFGISTDRLPEWMREISFAPISPAKNPAHYSDNQKVFCFLLALAQLSVAHIKCVIADRKSLKCLGDLGSLMQLWGMFYVVMNMVVDGIRFPLSDKGAAIPVFGGALVLPSNMPLIALGVLGAGFVLSFVFSNYNGSLGESILESCKNIISVLLGVVNVFSDIVSYIRLWAVALAGAAISETVNAMAGPWLGKLTLFVAGVVLLVFGHGLNMILNVLSVIVHGVRLNTLEFSQHLGMAWSGTKYRPFAER